MKTVAQLAKEFDVSVQTIYRKIKNVKQDVKQPLTVKQGGILYITTHGEEILTAMFNRVKSNVKQKAETPENRVFEDTGNVKLIVNLEEQVKFLRDQIANRDQIIKENKQKIDEKDHEIKEYFMMLAHISGEVKKLQAPNENKIEEEEIIEHRPVEEKKGFFKRLFGID